MQYAVILKSGDKEIIEGIYNDRSTAGECSPFLPYLDVLRLNIPVDKPIFIWYNILTKNEGSKHNERKN